MLHPADIIVGKCRIRPRPHAEAHNLVISLDPFLHHDRPLQNVQFAFDADGVQLGFQRNGLPIHKNVLLGCADFDLFAFISGILQEFLCLFDIFGIPHVVDRCAEMRDPVEHRGIGLGMAEAGCLGDHIAIHGVCHGLSEIKVVVQRRVAEVNQVPAHTGDFL